MKRKRSKRQRRTFKIIKFFGSVIIFTALILLSIHAFVEIFENELFDMLVQHVEKSSGGLYRITYGQVHLDFFKGTVRVENLAIDLDREILQQIKTGTRPGQILIKTSLSQLSIEGISYLPLVFDRTLHIDQLSLRGGKVVIFKLKNRRVKRSRTAFKPVKTIIDLFAIEKASFKILEADRRESILDIPSISLRLTAFKLVPFFSFDSGVVTLVEPSFIFPQGFYNLRAKRLSLSKSLLTSTIALNGFELQPRYNEYQFARLKGYQTDRIALKVDHTVCKGIEFADFFKHQHFNCRRLTVEHPQLEIFRDKNIPRRTRGFPKKFPQQLLCELALKLRIDQIDIRNGQLAIRELAKNEKRPGRLFFNEIRAELKHIANDPGWLKKKIPAVMTASARVMGKSLCRVKLVALVLHEKNRFTLSGSLDKIDMKSFNPILQPNAHIRIRTGTLDMLHFFAQIDQDLAQGTMKFLYRDLKISILRVKEGGKYERRGFPSFLANVIIYQHNPRPGKEFREGRIFYKREGSLSFFAYLGKALLSGVKSSIGM